MAIRSTILGIWAAGCVFLAGASFGQSETEPLVHFGMCDASAALAVGPEMFAVANDEDNVLRVYRRREGGVPVASVDLSGFLEVDPKHPESDLEGVARLGDRVYWITSHGRNKDGKRRESRYRLIATRLVLEGTNVTVQAEGKPCKRLLVDLLADSRYRGFHLDTASLRPPKEPEALNIEGLCPGGGGKLWIGFRNPIPQGKALLAPLLNPGAVVEGAEAKFGDPLLLPLDGLGIRDMVEDSGMYWILAGAIDGKEGTRIYRWQGEGSTPQWMSGVVFKKFNPEALVVYSGAERGWLQVMSDDGTLRTDGDACKEVKDPLRQRFRSWWLQLLKP